MNTDCTVSTAVTHMGEVVAVPVVLLVQTKNKPRKRTGDSLLDNSAKAQNTSKANAFKMSCFLQK